MNSNNTALISIGVNTIAVVSGLTTIKPPCGMFTFSYQLQH